MPEQPVKTQEEVLAALSAPFQKTVNGKVIPAHKWKVQSFNADKSKGMCVPFLNRQLVSDRLNKVLGLSGWQFELKEVSDGSKIGTLSCCISDKWISRSDIGVKSAQEGEKGSASDALKRCATLFGVGLYLSEMRSQWLKCEPYGRSAIPVDPKGNKLLYDGLTNYINGISSKQGLLAEIIKLDNTLWSRPEIKALWNEFKL